MGYPFCLPTELLLRHPQVEEATRCQTPRTKETIRQITVTLRGPLLPQLSLGRWGSFYLCPWVPEPLRFYRCHRFGHHQVFCANIIKCRICSGSRKTQECLVKYKAKQDIVHHCSNCKQAHQAWNKSCPARLRLVERGRERQAAWIANQQKTATMPAPPGTFVWVEQLPTAPHPAPRSTPISFPPLPPSAAALPQPPIISLSSRRSSRTTRSTQTIAPLSTTPPLTTYYLFTSTSPLHFLHPDTRHASADFLFSVQ